MRNVFCHNHADARLCQSVVEMEDVVALRGRQPRASLLAIGADRKDGRVALVAAGLYDHGKLAVGSTQVKHRQRERRRVQRMLAVGISHGKGRLVHHLMIAHVVSSRCRHVVPLQGEPVVPDRRCTHIGWCLAVVGPIIESHHAIVVPDICYPMVQRAISEGFGRRCALVGEGIVHHNTIVAVRIEVVFLRYSAHNSVIGAIVVGTNQIETAMVRGGVDGVVRPTALVKVKMRNHQATATDALVPSRLLMVLKQIVLIGCVGGDDVGLIAFRNVLQRKSVGRIMDDAWCHPSERKTLECIVDWRHVSGVVVSPIVHDVIPAKLIIS